MPARRNTTTRDRHRATIARSRPPCALCGDEIDYTLTVVLGEHGNRCPGPLDCAGCVPHPLRFEVDHIVPRNRGGSDDLANKQASHRRCNRAKSDHADSGPILRRSGSLTRPR
ncbi:HNH endonuclease [Micromonospora tulbaghiae]|uniref:HNH endonuclease n=1 Tax=Micromonospora tulbaghiae TaxID=479978 RepID=A0A386WLR5_9ACTN|nr:HNH endonuclease [Micromonospora tulbaghiae]AYF29297.1 HNH endonuclease [Micromonospora tulbaghiae]